jgi:cell division protein FtsI/penicillin-binding protein 2
VGVTAVAIEYKTGRVLSATGASLSKRVHPGSAVKPLTSVALIEARAIDPRACTGDLRIANRRLACSHPAVPGGVDLPVAIAYSCNQFFAANAARIDVAANFRRFDLEAPTPTSPEQRALMAIGEWGVVTTAVELANAYRRLASLRHDLILQGMRAASDYGTARLAVPAGATIAGKTGTSRASGLFAGWAPAEAPSVVVAVIVSGGRGGIDAAPVARALFEKHL